MWILENEGEAFDGKRLWLRPGKRYLFGRTVAEPGQLAIKGEKANTVSRKHVTITVDNAREGDGQNLRSRSKVTVEDLGSKIGTTVNGQKLKGEKYVISEDENTLQMGSLPTKFRITWFSVVLSYSFSGKELRQNPLSKLRSDLEQLDVKFLSEYDTRATTHVVAKKRNTAKGLQALINGRYIVNGEFVNAVIAAAAPQESADGVEASLLEGDFDDNWPNATEYLPEAANEPEPRQPADFAPNPERLTLFEGYTFIFYEQGQYDTLLGPITNGGGKAFVRIAIPNETQIDDFVRYVKEVAGERGLGEFEDGSEGKGVVVVRFIPSNPEALEWFSEFYTAVSLRLDHRLIDQKDFIGAILGNDASVLRRPLQVETQGESQDGPSSSGQRAVEAGENQKAATAQQIMSRRRARGPAKSRFKGFDMGDSEEDIPDSLPANSSASAVAESPQEGLFVSQHAASEEPEEPVRAGRSKRKRPASPVPPPEPRDIMQDFAPNAAQVKRRRIERGETAIPRQPSVPAEKPAEEQESSNTKLKARPKKGAKGKQESEVISAARAYRDEAEARARAEREELETGPDGLDLAEIRRLQVEEPMEIREAPAPPRTREKDIEDGRWDPAWNGRQNFKKFRQRGAATAARPPMRIIVPLQEVKSKGFGIGNDYWLEDEKGQKKKKGPSQTQSQSQGLNSGTGAGRALQSQRQAAPTRLGPDNSDMASSEYDDMDDVNKADTTLPSVRKSTQAAAKTSTQSQRAQTMAKSQPSRTTKRPAAAPPAKQQPAKRPKVIAIAASDDDDESEDELRFRFTKRR